MGRGGEIGTVFRKELLEVGRDKKTLVFMVVLPVILIPALLELTTGVMSAAEKEASERVLSVAVMGSGDGDDALEGVDRLASELFVGDGLTRVEATGDPTAAVTAGRADAVVRVGREVGGRREVEVFHDNAALTSKVFRRVEAALERVSATLRSERLAALGVVEADRQEALIAPLSVVARGVASMREVIGEGVGATLPFLLIVFCFLGAMYPAIDLAAGEKERGTLMTLWLAPVARWRIVMGKLLVVFVTGLVAAVLALVGLGVWLGLQSGQLEGALGEVLSAIGAVDLSLIGAVLVPTALIFASLLLGISIYAKSFKEAQSYIAPLNIAAIIPAFFATLPGVELDWFTAWVPVMNAALAIKELVKGTMDAVMLVPVFASGLGVGLALLWASTRWFARESVVFRR